MYAQTQRFFVFHWFCKSGKSLFYGLSDLLLAHHLRGKKKRGEKKKVYLTVATIQNDTLISYSLTQSNREKKEERKKKEK